MRISTRRVVDHRPEALLLATAAGVRFGVSDVAINHLTHAPGPLLSHDFPDQLHTNATRLDKTEPLLLLSDILTHPTHGLGLPAITRAVAKADDNAAPATLRAIEDQLRAKPDQLDDDTSIIVLAPSGMTGASDDQPAPLEHAGRN